MISVSAPGAAVELAGAVINFCQDLQERLPARTSLSALSAIALPSACISNLHLQKILYFMQLRSIQVHGRDGRIIGEDFEAWRFGPVLRSVYYAYRSYGAERIYDRQRSDPALLEEHGYLKPLIEKTALAMPFALVRLSHARNGAWYQARAQHEQIIQLDHIVQEAANLPNLETMQFDSLFAIRV